MRVNPIKPWLTSTGVEIPIGQLQKISRQWNATTWEQYLKWYESALRLRLLTPVIYDQICSEEIETIFEQFAHDTSSEKRILCEHLLSTLPAHERVVLRLHFIDGRTDFEIAAITRRSRSGVNLIKHRALSRLRRGHDGDEIAAREFMKGEISENVEMESSIWNMSLSYPVKEDRVYDPNAQKAELEKIRSYPLKKALSELSERQQRIVYLYFWCDFSINQIAREMRCGVNLVDQVFEAALSALKRKIMQIENGVLPGDGGPSCA